MIRKIHWNFQLRLAKKNFNGDIVFFLTESKDNMFINYTKRGFIFNRESLIYPFAIFVFSDSVKEFIRMMLLLLFLIEYELASRDNPGKLKWKITDHRYI